MNLIFRRSRWIVLGSLALLPLPAHARDHHHGKAAPPASSPPTATSQAKTHQPGAGEPKSDVKGDAKAAAVVEEAAPATARQVVQRESHIEFDERLVQGQTAAGAIYLFQRGESEFSSMVKLPASFRDRSVKPILPQTR